MITLSCTKKEFKDKLVFAEFSLSLPLKGLVFLRGKNGSGKTTLLSILSGRDSEYDGSLCLNDEKLVGKKMERYAEDVVSYCPQNPLIFENDKAIDNVLLPFPAKSKKKAIKIMESLGIGHLVNSRAGDLSSGEQQRLAIARCLYSERPVMLMDEPTAYLDQDNADIVLSTIDEYAGNHLVILSTNDRLPERFDSYPSIKIKDHKPILENSRFLDNKIGETKKIKSKTLWYDLVKGFRERPFSNILNILATTFFVALSVLFGSGLHTGTGSVFSLIDSSKQGRDYPTTAYLANADLLPAFPDCPGDKLITAYVLSENPNSKINLPMVWTLTTIDSLGENKLKAENYQFVLGGFPEKEGQIAIPSHSYESICQNFNLEAYATGSLGDLNAIGEIKSNCGNFTICGVFQAEYSENLDRYIGTLTDNAYLYPFSFYSTSCLAHSANGPFVQRYCLNNEENRNAVLKTKSIHIGASFLLLNKDLEEKSPISDSLPWFILILFAISLSFGVLIPIVSATIYSFSSSKRMLFLRLGGASRSSLLKKDFVLFLFNTLISAVAGIGLGIGFVYMYQWLYLDSLLGFATPFMQIGFDAILLSLIGTLVSIGAIWLLLRFFLFKTDISKQLIKAKEK